MCHFVKSTLRGLFGEMLKGFICLELYNNPLLASPSFPVLPWILLMRQLLNPASWMESLFMRFVLYMPQFPEQAGPCMPKPQPSCPVFENTGRAGKANQRAPYPPPPHFPTPSPARRGHASSLNSHSYSMRSLLFEQRQTLRDGRIGTFCIKDLLCRSKFKTIAFITARSRGHICIKSVFETFLPYLFSRLFFYGIFLLTKSLH